MMRVRRISNRREPTIALINIVFLMLVFFLLAGTIAQPVPEDVALVRVAEIDPSQPQGGLVIGPDGQLWSEGERLTDLADFAATLSREDRPDIRVIPDRDVPAMDLIRLAAALREAGAGRVLIVTERGLQ